MRAAAPETRSYRRDRERGALIAAQPAQGTEAVIVALHFDFEAGRIGGQQLFQFRFSRLGNSERVAGGVRQDQRHPRARQRRSGRRCVAQQARAGRYGQLAAECVPHLALVALHALGKRQPRQRVEAEDALRRPVVIRHLRARQQLAPQSGLRQVELAQQAPAMLRALERFARGVGRPRQVADFVAPRFEIEREHAVGQRLQRRLVARRPRAQRGKQPARAQVGKAAYRDFLRVAHAGRRDALIQRAVPLRAVAHLRRVGGQVLAKRRRGRRAARRQRKRQGKRGRREPARAHWRGSRTRSRRAISRRSISSTIPRNCSSMLLRITISPIKGGIDCASTRPVQVSSIRPPPLGSMR